MSQPSISIIAPTYNRAGLIGQMIESVLNQTFQDWELIIVDDGSTDDTQAVVAGYADSRIRYVAQENAGASVARNTGIALAAGRFIACIDSDDVMLPHNLHALMATLDAHPEAGCAYGWFYFMDESGEPMPSVHGSISGEVPAQIDQPWPGRMPPPSGTSGEGQILPELLSTTEGTLAMGAFLARREWVDLIGGFNLQRRQHQEHWDFFIRLARAGCTFACCRQAVLLCRDHGGGAHRDYQKMVDARLDILKQFYIESAADANLAALADSVRDRAYRTTYIDAAKGAYSSGRFADAAQFINLASQIASPTTAEMDDMVSRCVKWLIDNPDVDAGQRIRDGFAQLDDTTVARKSARQAIGLLNLNVAFRDYASGHPQQALRHSLNAVANDPHHVTNKGLIKIVLGSLISSALLIVGIHVFLE